MKNDKALKLSIANSRLSVDWKTQKIFWSELIDKISKPVISTIPFGTYLKLPKSEQTKEKDVGGFVGGELRGGRRINKNMVNREVVALDLDSIPSEMTGEVLLKIKNLGCGYAVYSTRKHEPTAPRLRVLIPTNRPMSIEEYEPVARKLASLINIDWCDPTTFEIARLMYWPSRAVDGQYIFTYEDKPFADVDGLLKTYSDWRDMAAWPRVPGEIAKHSNNVEQQQRPETKSGLIGAFCRTYDIAAVMEKYLPGVYLPAGEDRYTFAGGSTFAGAIVYDGVFLYSHHATDPASGHLCNAFDLVRLHKFGSQDDAAAPNTPVNRLPSYKSMQELAARDSVVTELMIKEKMDAAKADFETEEPTDEQSDTDWLKKLDMSSESGKPQKTIKNVLTVLDYDPNIKGKIYFNEFSHKVMVDGRLPWMEDTEKREWSDADDSGVREYIETIYGITGKEKIQDGLNLHFEKNKRHEVQDFLSSLVWDGKPRLDTLLIDYLGADDTEYTRAVTRKTLVGAVARAVNPGCKFDYVLTLIGQQGIGKSTLIRFLGKDWFSDSLTTFEGKEACELIQGVWIAEIAELAGMSKAEVNTIKHFLTKTTDRFRVPYSRHTKEFKRNCIFIGTTNDVEFLRDATGNRRFWPVDLKIKEPIKSVFDDLPGEVDQIWAEAVHYFHQGETVFLPPELEAQARQQQEVHSESNPKLGIITEFINKPVPGDWNSRTLDQRLAYWNFEHKTYQGTLMPRDRICAAEIWVECFGSHIGRMKRSDAFEINILLGKIDRLEKHNSTTRFGCHGTQKGFIFRD